ncbi:MAG: hypothetical protein JO165_11505 [Candidatus Eremiobacteraeota bacterium]|nr:hypothetical protein [Candidatus Eremiobacteraeota bacterium]
MKSTRFASILTSLLIAGCASSATNYSNGGSGALPNVEFALQGRNATAAHYILTELKSLGGNASSAASINQIGWITGTSNRVGDHYSEAVLWRDRDPQPLGTLGGPNSGIDWPNHNDRELTAGISETRKTNPLNEDWSCQAFFPTVPDTKRICLGFAWHPDRMVPLGTLGGYDSYAAGTNNRGQIVGWAETPVHDATCTAATHFPNSFYQVLQFEPVFWTAEGDIHRLPTLPGDPDGAATATNDNGVVVGISGKCDQAVGRFTAAHAVYWQNGVVHDIGGFGGISWNTPQDVNKWGHIVGFANLPGDSQGQLQPMAFFWSKERGLTKIRPLPGDTNTEANGLNDFDQVVGVSANANTGAARAFIWENGRTMDLNCFVPPNSPLHLLVANDINDRGVIVGQALVRGTTRAPAFLATPPQDWDAATAIPLQSDVRAPILPRAMYSNVMGRVRARPGR